MFRDSFKKVKAYHSPDKILVFFIFLAMAIGLILLFSASSVAAYVRSGNSLYFLKHQLYGLALGIPAFIILSKIDYHRYRNFAIHFLVISVGFLVLTFIPGLSASYGKAGNWINIFGFSLQPSEFVKIFFLLYLAAWLDTKKEKLNSLGEGLIPFILIFIPIAALIMMQPDFGTLLIIFSSSVICYFVAGAPKKHFFIGIVIALIAIAVLVNFKSNKMERIECYRHPESDVAGKCYQVNQSLIAIGSGGFWGRGLGESRQKFMYLPEVWSDSIFAAVAEELGFVFSLAVIAIFFVIFYRGIKIAKNTPDFYGKILAAGLVSWVLVQTILNIGGSTNLIPMTGVPLPFVSAGGSSVLALFSAMGILVNISRQTK